MEDFRKRRKRKAEEEGRTPAWGPSAHEPMGALLMAAANMLQRDAGREEGSRTKKKKKVFGLEPDSDQSGASEDDDGGTDGQLKGTKGALLQSRLDRSMAKNPDAFYRDMRARMLKALSADTDNHQRAAQFATQMPVEKGRILGYFIWAVGQWM